MYGIQPDDEQTHEEFCNICIASECALPCAKEHGRAALKEYVKSGCAHQPQSEPMPRDADDDLSGDSDGEFEESNAEEFLFDWESPDMGSWCSSDKDCRSITPPHYCDRHVEQCVPGLPSMCSSQNPCKIPLHECSAGVCIFVGDPSHGLDGEGSGSAADPHDPDLTYADDEPEPECRIVADSDNVYTWSQEDDMWSYPSKHSIVVKALAPLKITLECDFSKIPPGVKTAGYLNLRALNPTDRKFDVDISHLAHKHFLTGKTEMRASIYWSDIHNKDWIDRRAVYTIRAHVVVPDRTTEKDISDVKRQEQASGLAAIRSSVDIPRNKVSALNATLFENAVAEVLTHRGWPVPVDRVTMLSVSSSTESTSGATAEKDGGAVLDDEMHARRLLEDDNSEVVSPEMARVRYEILVEESVVAEITAFITSEDYVYPLAKAMHAHNVLGPSEEGECWCDIMDTLEPGEEIYTVSEKPPAEEDVKNRSIIEDLILLPGAITAIVLSVLIIVVGAATYVFYVKRRAQKSRLRAENNVSAMESEIDKMALERKQMAAEMEALRSQKDAIEAKQQAIAVNHADALRELQRAQALGDRGAERRLEAELRSLENDSRTCQAMAEQMESDAQMRQVQIQDQLLQNRSQGSARLKQRLEEKRQRRLQETRRRQEQSAPSDARRRLTQRLTMRRGGGGDAVAVNIPAPAVVVMGTVVVPTS